MAISVASTGTIPSLLAYASKLALFAHMYNTVIASGRLIPLERKFDVELGEDVPGSCDSIVTKTEGGEKKPDPQASLKLLQGYWEDSYHLAVASTQTRHTAVDSTKGLTTIAQNGLKNFLRLEISPSYLSSYKGRLDDVNRWMSFPSRLYTETRLKGKPRLLCNDDALIYAPPDDYYVTSDGSTVKNEETGDDYLVKDVRSLNTLLDSCKSENSDMVNGEVIPADCWLYFLEGRNEYVALDRAPASVDLCDSPYNYGYTNCFHDSYCSLVLCSSTVIKAGKRQRLSDFIPEPIYQDKPNSVEPYFDQKPWFLNQTGAPGITLFHELLHLVLGRSKTTFPDREDWRGQLVEEIYNPLQIVYYPQIYPNWARLTLEETTSNAESYTLNALAFELSTKWVCISDGIKTPMDFSRGWAYCPPKPPKGLVTTTMTNQEAQVPKATILTS